MSAASAVFDAPGCDSVVEHPTINRDKTPSRLIQRWLECFFCHAVPCLFERSRDQVRLPESMSTTFGFSSAAAMVAEGSIKRNANAILLFIIFTLLLPYDLVTHLDGAIGWAIVADADGRTHIGTVTFGAEILV